MSRLLRAAAALAAAVVLSAHVGSPNVFFSGKAGPYDVRVVVRPPEVVPGIARVTVRTLEDVQRISIRPVYWRAGSKGSPSADETRRLEGDARTFVGSLWLMQHGANSVDVIIEGDRGTANVLVPVPAVATGQLEMGGGLAILLGLLALVLCAALVTIVYKGAGESLLHPDAALDAERRRRARRVAAIALPIIGALVFGGARWWASVDREYSENVYRPSPLVLERDGAELRVQLADTIWQPGRVISGLVPDHGKLMHLFLVRSDDARAFAHLHPAPADSGPMPALSTRLPPLPAGEYHVFGDVVHETGFERTLVGSLTLPESANARARGSDPDDAWFVGDASRDSVVRLGDGSVMRLELRPRGGVEASEDVTLRLAVTDVRGIPVTLEPYLGMAAHAVVVDVNGDVYVHLHPSGTVSAAAQEVFRARDRGDTTQAGRLQLTGHLAHAAADSLAGVVEFPYAFPRAGSYRLFVQVKRAGRVLTGAFVIAVAGAAQDR